MAIMAERRPLRREVGRRKSLSRKDLRASMSQSSQVVRAEVRRELGKLGLAALASDEAGEAPVETAPLGG